MFGLDVATITALVKLLFDGLAILVIIFLYINVNYYIMVFNMALFIKIIFLYCLKNTYTCNDKFGIMIMIKVRICTKFMKGSFIL